jgi:hypothetical protein
MAANNIGTFLGSLSSQASDKPIESTSNGGAFTVEQGAKRVLATLREGSSTVASLQQRLDFEPLQVLNSIQLLQQSNLVNVVGQDVSLTDFAQEALDVFQVSQ